MRVVLFWLILIAFSGAALGASLEQVLFDEALKVTGGDRQQAAKRLGCGRNTLTRKLGPKKR